MKLPRKPLPGTSVNKGKKKGRGVTILAFLVSGKVRRARVHRAERLTDVKATPRRPRARLIC